MCHFSIVAVPMVLFSIGLPGRFARWCDSAIQHLAGSRFGTIETLALNNLSELASSVMRTRASHLVACCRQPVPSLQTEILRSDRPFLVALGKPRGALRDLVTLQGYTMLDATRAVASSCAAMVPLARGAHSRTLSPDDLENPVATLTAIARHFQIPLQREAIATAADDLAELRSEAEAQADGHYWWEQLAKTDQIIADGALRPYIDDIHAVDLRKSFVWQPELFYTHEGPSNASTPLTGPVDITGRVRYLVSGPSINLPAGSWAANVVLGFSEEAAGLKFLIEIFAGRQLAHTWVECISEQVVESRLHFTIGPSIDEPVQIRIRADRAAFDGKLGLGYVEITSLSPAPENISQ